MKYACKVEWKYWNLRNSSTINVAVPFQESPLLAHDAILLVAKASNDAIYDSRWNASAMDPTNGELLQEYILKVTNLA